MPDPVPAPNEPFTRADYISILIAVLLAVLLAMAAWRSYDHNIFILAGSMGGLGGLLHEFVQSGGKFMVVQKKSDGIYLGTLAGALLGIIAGILMTRGYLTIATDKTNFAEITYEAFVAGLALKGVVEAAAGKPVEPGGQHAVGDHPGGAGHTAGGAGQTGGGAGNTGGVAPADHPAQ